MSDEFRQTNQITPEIKDRILFYLRDNFELQTMGYTDTREFLLKTDTDFDSLRAVLYQFERKGFLEDVGVGRNNLSFIIRAELHDFAHSGGFCMQEIVLKSNLEKLGYEIDNLRKELGPDHLDTVSKISTIIGVMLTGLSLKK